MGLLSLAIWTPIFFGVVLLALGRDDQAPMVRWIALVGAVVGLAVTVPLYTGFKLGTAALQFVEKAPWIQNFNIHYHLGVDGISLWLILLTAFINVVVIIASWESITTRVNQYMGAFLILSGLMIGVFTKHRREWSINDVAKLVRTHERFNMLTEQESVQMVQHMHPLRIDAHQHFWQVARGDYHWMTPELVPLYRDFGPEDLRPLLAAGAIDGTVLVGIADELDRSAGGSGRLPEASGARDRGAAGFAPAAPAGCSAPVSIDASAAAISHSASVGSR